jgi:hypothetical protein
MAGPLARECNIEHRTSPNVWHWLSQCFDSDDLQKRRQLDPRLAASAQFATALAPRRRLASLITKSGFMKGS